MKKFLIVGNVNAVTYKDVFPLIKNNEMWLGPSITSGDRRFDVPESYPLEAAGCGIDKDGIRFIRVNGIRWFTNLDHQKKHKPIVLTKHYSPDVYQKYDNYNAIEVSKVVNIPMDYDGVMGVPVTFLDKYCPEQFEIVGFWNAGTAGEVLGATYCEAVSAKKIITWNGPTVNKQTKYFRILIKRKGT